ncbi:MAG: hypothetical protein K6T77_05060 [candidate division WOR-3 bacterium]|jgi:hypothetical protein|nr:hypothetical protein [candidate division WOR-3 bacterium]MCR4424429.1 hypothetical protein [candidate division WOR-3 bacterium]MDH7518247.1 hypothetical protein [bacterium]
MVWEIGFFPVRFMRAVLVGGLFGKFTTGLVIERVSGCGCSDDEAVLAPVFGKNDWATMRSGKWF